MALRIACVWTPVDYFAGSVVCQCSRTHSAANPAVRDMRVHACRIGMHAEPREHRFFRQWMQLQTYDPRNMLAMLCKVASFTVPVTGITPAGTSFDCKVKGAPARQLCRERPTAARVS